MLNMKENVRNSWPNCLIEHRSKLRKSKCWWTNSRKSKHGRRNGTAKRKTYKNLYHKPIRLEKEIMKSISNWPPHLIFQQGDPPPNPPSNRKHDKKLNKKKLQNQIRPSRVDSMVNVSIQRQMLASVIWNISILQLESAGIKFNDLRGTGVSLRSQRMKLPANVGQKKTKALEQTLSEFKVGKNNSDSIIIIVTRQFRHGEWKNCPVSYRTEDILLFVTFRKRKMSRA